MRTLFHLWLHPHSRKVRLSLAEKNLKFEAIIEKTWERRTEYMAMNPAGDVPLMIEEDGTVLANSAVICEYLDSIQGDVRLFPSDSLDRWKALRCQALADGVLDAAVAIRYETVFRPEEKCWSPWVEGQMGKIRRGLDTLEDDLESFRYDVDIGTITTACAMGHLDFRFPAEDWRRGRPNLWDWYAQFALRGSMVATEPARLL